MKTVNNSIRYGGETFLQLTKRHLLVFFRNKIRVFFTLMVPFIIFAIYIFFLRDLELSTAQNILTEIEEQEGLAKGALSGDSTLAKYVETIIDSWMFSGILAISTMTVSLQTNGLIVCDKERGVNRDFTSSPINRNILIASYFFFNVIVTALICTVFLLVCLVYLAFMGEFLLTFWDFLTIFTVLLFASVGSVLLTEFICSFISSDSTMVSVNTIFSTAIGFLIGAYMPLGALPVWVQNICMFIPGTYSCSLLRYSFMATSISSLTEYVAALPLADGASLISGLTENFGYRLQFFGCTVEPQWQAFAQFVFIAVLVVANIFSGKKLVTVLGAMTKKIKDKDKGAA